MRPKSTSDLASKKELKWKWNSKCRRKRKSTCFVLYYFSCSSCFHTTHLNCIVSECSWKKKKNKELPVEELEIRAKEDALFEKLKAPPSLLEGVTDVLNDKSKSKAVAIQRSNDKKRRIEREELKRNELVNAFDGVIVEPEQKKRQRGSRKRNADWWYYICSRGGH